MNNKLANVIKTYIETLSWHDKVAGLVQTANIRVKDGDSITDKSYPIACDVDYETCIKGHYQDLAPDSKKKSVVYFEDKGCTFDRQEGDRLHYKSSLRLVAWLNLKLLACDDCGVSQENCGVSGDYVLDIIQALPFRPFDTGGFYGVMIHPPAQIERSVEIFSKYTYNETATQYLLYPYDFFALDFDIDFMINTLCKEPIRPCS